MATSGTDEEEWTDTVTAPFPHCDSGIVHPPKSCKYCDMYPVLQKRRIDEGVNFTGEQIPGKAVCPSEVRRPLDIINRWHGNRPVAIIEPRP